MNAGTKTVHIEQEFDSSISDDVSIKPQVPDDAVANGSNHSPLPDRRPEGHPVHTHRSCTIER